MRMSFFLCNFARKIGIMNILFIIVSVMTLTVQSNSSVSVLGDYPYNMVVDYSNTGTKGNVKQGDVAALNLTQLGGIAIEKVEVYINSNQNGGAGTLEARVHERLTTLGAITGTFKDWTGSYDSQYYHAISLFQGNVPNVHDLSIQLIGTANSLHIEKYEITWSAAPARTVTLMKGAKPYTTLTESGGGKGVVLPALSDSAEWHFVGWSETEFWVLNTIPDLVAAGSKYFPNTDCSLWAVYLYKPMPEETYLKELESGTYVYVNTANNIAISGIPNTEGTMSRTPVNPSNANQHYYIEFNATCDSATIKHVSTNTYIGYKADGTKLVVQPSKWCVFHNDNKTGFYMNCGNKSYLLWTDILNEYYQEYAGLFGPIDPTTTPTALMLIPEKSDQDTYTCHPESKEPTEIPTVGTQKETIVNFGIYELHIINGHKYLRLKQ